MIHALQTKKQVNKLSEEFKFLFVPFHVHTHPVMERVENNAVIEKTVALLGSHGPRQSLAKVPRDLPSTELESHSQKETTPDKRGSSRGAIQGETV